MNLVEAKGGKKYQRDIAETVVYYMIDKLLPRFKTLDIEIVLKGKLDADAIGYCNAETNRREFVLEISKNLSLKELVSTICHEMIHVKQYVRKEMDVLVYDGKQRWKRSYTPDSTDYFDLPWEKEAYRLEKKYTNLIWEEGVL